MRANPQRLAGYICGFLPDHGWRWAFTTCGMIGVIYAMPLLALLPQSRASVLPTLPRKRRKAEVIRGLIGNRNFLLLVLYFTLPAIAGWVVRLDARYSARKFSLGQGTAGVSGSSVCANRLAGWRNRRGALADRWARHSNRAGYSSAPSGLYFSRPLLVWVTRARDGRHWPDRIRIRLRDFRLQQHADPFARFARPELRATGYGIMNLVSISIGGFATGFRCVT